MILCTLPQIVAVKAFLQGLKFSEADIKKVRYESLPISQPELHAQSHTTAI